MIRLMLSALVMPAQLNVRVRLSPSENFLKDALITQILPYVSLCRSVVVILLSHSLHNIAKAENHPQNPYGPREIRGPR